MHKLDFMNRVWKCADMNSEDSRGFRFILICLCLCLATGVARATTFLTLQSTYLGNGWFRYQMEVMNDPFFAEAAITGLNIPFTNQIDQVAGTNGWSYQSGNGWEFTNGYPARPYSETFLVRSSATSYRLAPMTNWNGAVVLMSLALNDVFPGFAGGVFSQNIVGLASLPCLVPCRPEEADGSPTNFVFNLKLVPDVNLNQLIQTNGDIYGVDFAWNLPATFLLLGSSDFKTWANISYLWSDPPETVWTTNAPLTSFGNFFRVELVADGHQTKLPPLNGAALAPRAVAKGNIMPARITGCKLVGDKIEVSVSGPSAQSMQVQAMSSRGIILQSQTVLPLTSPVTVNFDVAGLPQAVLFQAHVQ